MADEPEIVEWKRVTPVNEAERLLLRYLDERIKELSERQDGEPFS